MDLDTFLTTLYVDWYKGEISARFKRHAGPALQMSDSEVLTVAIAGQWRVGVPWRSERVVRYMLKHGRSWFPSMLKRSQFNQRVRDLWAAFVCLQQELAQMLCTTSTLYEVVDCTPIPHYSLSQAKSHSRHWLSGKKGHGGNHGGWYHGEQLLLCASDSGVITGWMLGLANIDDRWLMEALVSSRQGCKRVMEIELPKRRTYKTRGIPSPESISPALRAGVNRGMTYLADGGFAGPRWIKHWQREYGAASERHQRRQARQA